MNIHCMKRRDNLRKFSLEYKSRIYIASVRCIRVANKTKEEKHVALKQTESHTEKPHMCIYKYIYAIYAWAVSNEMKYPYRKMKLKKIHTHTHYTQLLDTHCAIVTQWKMCVPARIYA